MKFAQNIVLFLSIFLVIGLVYIAFFNVYQTDDYIFSYSTRKLGILGNIKRFYTFWGGRYFGYTINMLNPLSKDPGNILPKIYPVFLFLTFIGVAALNFKQYFGYSFKEALIKGFLLFFFYAILLVSLPEHFYWITGANIYFLPVILSGFLLYFQGKFQESGKKIWFYLSAVFIAVLMGSNEIVELILLGILVLFYFQNRTKENKILLTIGFTGFLISFLAPGNFNRMQDSSEVFYMKMIKKTGIFVVNSTYIFIKITLLLPLFIKIFEQDLQKIIEKISFKKALIIWSISFLPLLFTGFISNTIARQFETIIFFYLLTFAVVVAFKFKEIKKYWWLTFIIVFLPETTFFPPKYANFNFDFNVNNIIKELLHTDFVEYDKEIENRINTIKNSTQDSIVLDKIKNVPKILYFDEMASVNEEKTYVNDQLQSYFNKKYIRIKSK
ncbi:hypothetical protein SAMN05421664_1591 [Chryseobacterium soldanellicola]|uniref:Glycosyltransferase RgtA/B/C/D-like domain-containing protein n=1 Tax=Chryseobacterium soldanellicola TaxID=311333 RepID=A0A1H1AUE8_9FLAO|nr:DUF6056 family protein [Chryseobacterium soldanellicola]SDQ43378.1 hypothetical protein SAMN05421664_1591 [Chryseobacterium soldanellicola]